MALKELVSRRVLDDILGKLSKPGQWKVLVLDQTSTRIISACCRMHEVMEKGITLVESLEKEREPLPHMEAVYIMRPTPDNISRLIADFQRTVEPKGLYKAIHVFFIQKCTILDKLDGTEAARRIQTLQEANIAFLPYESRAFTLDFPDDAFESYFTNDYMKKDDLFDLFADQLGTVCALLGEYPSIRAWNDGENRCRRLASKLQDKLDEFKSNRPDLGKGPKQNSEFIILDRGFDVITPVVHEATFQCMVYDYLNLDKDVYKYQAHVGGDGQTKQKDVILNENDELWVKWRHGHIADVSKEVSQSLKDFSKKKKLGDPKDPDISVKALARHIKRAPQYQKELGQYSLHLDLVSNCMKKYKKELFEVEQSLATGTDTGGNPVVDPLTLLNPFIFGRKYSVYDKLRLQILYTLQKKGLTTEEFTTMIQQSEIPSAERPIIPNLMHLGIPVIKGESVKQGRTIERKQREETTYTDSRYSPLIRDILEYAIEGKLSEDYCPYTKGKRTSSSKSSYSSSVTSSTGGSSATTSVRKQYDWIKSDKKSKPARGGATGGASAITTIAARDLPTIFVFIIGGVTYSELRTVYKLAEENKQYDFLIGATSVVTPSEFLGQVKRLPVRMRV